MYYIYDKMSASLARETKRLKMMDKPTPLVYDKLYTDTLMSYPEGYDENHPQYAKQPHQYVKICDNPKRYKAVGGINCSICFDKKPAGQTWWCRVCATAVCAGCYRGCRQGAVSRYQPVAPVVTTGDYDVYDTLAEQPPCPTCRSVGTFGTKGVQGTRIIGSGEDEGYGSNRRKKNWFGPNVTADVTLKDNIRDYITTYNKIQKIIITKVADDIKQGEANVEAIENDGDYQDFACCINEQEHQIRQLEQTIRDIQAGIYKLKCDREKHVKKLITETAPITKDFLEGKGVTLKKAEWENDHQAWKIDVLAKALKFDYPRRFFSPNVNLAQNDLGLWRHAYFRKHNGADGGWFKELDDKLKVAQERYEYLMTGAIPIDEAKVCEVDKMSDAELEEQMRIMMEVMKRRKGEGGACKGE